MNPIYIAKKPIRTNMYLTARSPLVKPVLYYLKVLSIKHIKHPTIRMMEPWPMSPNITPKRKGKVMEVNKAGLASLYPGTPYVLVIT